MAALAIPSRITEGSPRFCPSQLIETIRLSVAEV
jgi:hypothetical protein